MLVCNQGVLIGDEITGIVPTNRVNNDPNHVARLNFSDLRLFLLKLIDCLDAVRAPLAHAN